MTSQSIAKIDAPPRHCVAHVQALVGPVATIGSGTRVWAFAHVLPEAVVGADCNFCDHVFAAGGETVGDGVTFKQGGSSGKAYIWMMLSIGASMPPMTTIWCREASSTRRAK